MSKQNLLHDAAVSVQDEVTFSLDPEFIVTAMEELKEFATYHFLPLAEHLTSDHIESFLRCALVKPSSS